MGQTEISCTDRKLPGSLPELRLTISGVPCICIADSLEADCSGAAGLCDYVSNTDHICGLCID
jgi:hypothetical protein